MNNKPTSTTVIEPTEIAVTQTIIRAQNGDVIVADETGLRMRLSDRVIEDIAMRLGKSGHGFGAMQQRDSDWGKHQNCLQIWLLKVFLTGLTRCCSLVRLWAGLEP